MKEEDAIFPVGLSVDDARSRIVEIAAQNALPSESIALETALGRILANDVIAPHDVPGFINSAMDGFALRNADLPAAGERSFCLLGEIFAGGHDAPEIVAGGCVRITTGAPLPRGADTVVMKENTRVEGANVYVATGTAPNANVRPAGEDFQAGDLALRRGQRLTPARLGALASFGQREVGVVCRPRAILLTTGDELTPPGEALEFGRIYDSNRYSLGAVLEQHGTALVRHERLRDDPRVLSDALQRAAKDADIIVSSGGVSAGEADYLPRLIAQIGKVHFWKVRIKPGMPFLCGSIGRALVCALPGNPVSGVATLLTLVRPALDAMAGATDSATRLRARLKQPIRKTHARAEFQRAGLECDDQGTLWATSLKQQGSGMLRGVAEADALIMLSEAAREYAAGEVVELLPLPGWPA